jgi:hypothetical protein
MLRYSLTKAARPGSVKEAYSVSLFSFQHMRESRDLHLWSSGGTICFPSTHEGGQTLWRLSYMIHIAQSKQTLELLLNGENIFSIFLQFSWSGGTLLSRPEHSPLLLSLLREK